MIAYLAIAAAQFEGQRAVALVILVVATVLEAVGQISFKLAAEQGIAGHGVRSLLRRAITNRWILLGVLIFIAEAVLWTLVLRMLELSIAYPAGAPCFVAVAVLSRVRLKEKVRLSRWIGVILIICGTAVVAFSGIPHGQ